MKVGVDNRGLLSGRYEADLLESGRIDVYSASLSRFNIRSGSDSFCTPCVDRARIKQGLSKPVWPNGAPFAVCLTHDVDQVSRYDLRGSWRRVANRLRFFSRERHRRFRRSVLAAVYQAAQSIGHVGGGDLLHCYEKWLHLEEEVGAKSTFLFLPERPGIRHFTDGSYRFDDKIRFDGQACSVGEMMREMARRGWEVGLHATWNSWGTVDEMKCQKGQVAQEVGRDVVSVRQHCLHFDIRTTPHVQNEAGLLYDSTLGFNDDIGFRFGTSYPWRLRDLQAKQALPLLEIPLIVQDKALLVFLATGNKDLAFEYLQAVVESVESVGGVLTLSWHPNRIEDMYVDLYRESLSLLKSKEAWFGTMEMVGRHWNQRSSCSRGLLHESESV